jgi:hypothetical protein
MNRQRMCTTADLVNSQSALSVSTIIHPKSREAPFYFESGIFPYFCSGNELSATSTISIQPRNLYASTLINMASKVRCSQCGKKMDASKMTRHVAHAPGHNIAYTRRGGVTNGHYTPAQLIAPSTDHHLDADLDTGIGFSAEEEQPPEIYGVASAVRLSGRITTLSYNGAGKPMLTHYLTSRPSSLRLTPHRQ